MTPEEKAVIRPSRVIMGNLLLAGMKKQLTGESLDDSILNEILEAYEHYSAASPILMATGMSVSGVRTMDEKLDALRLLAKLRESLKKL